MVSLFHPLADTSAISVAAGRYLGFLKQQATLILEALRPHEVHDE